MYEKRLKPLFNKYGVFFHRIESPKVPDIYTARNGLSIWLEMKCVNHRCDLIKPSWRIGQLSWMKCHEAKSPCQVFLALWYQDEIYILPPKAEYSEEEVVCQKESLMNYFRMFPRIRQ